jgi:hypothetical protein
MNAMDAAVTFATLEVPAVLGRAQFGPTVEAAKKLGYALDDETGWTMAIDGKQFIHPAILSMYLWWPQGFYIREPGAIGHFDQFKERFGHLLEYPWLHGKTEAKFFRLIEAGEKLAVEVSLSEKYERRQREFIVILARFTGNEGTAVADYRHTVMIRSHAAIRGISDKAGQ